MPFPSRAASIAMMGVLCSALPALAQGAATATAGSATGQAAPGTSSLAASPGANGPTGAAGPARAPEVERSTSPSGETERGGK